MPRVLTGPTTPGPLAPNTLHKQHKNTPGGAQIAPPILKKYSYKWRDVRVAYGAGLENR